MKTDSTPSISEKDLPAPRLELRYRAALPEDGFGRNYPTVCEYNFVFPLDKYDVRAEHEDPQDGHKFGHFKTKTVRLGLSATTRALEATYYAEGDKVDTPFRDGAHIRWDAVHFGNPPLYAVSQGRATKLDPLPESEAKEAA